MNEHLKNFMHAGDVHDMRVELRKFAVVGRETLHLHEMRDCVFHAFQTVKKLGYLRDMEVAGCVRVSTSIDLLSVRRKFRSCRVPRIYGSKLMVAEALLREFRNLRNAEDFHEVRKSVRRAWYLGESIGLDVYSVKTLSKELGEIRDKALKLELCDGIRPNYPDVMSVKGRAMELVGLMILRNNTFEHAKNGVREEYERWKGKGKG